MLENIALSFQSVWAHKIRSFLTMLGVIIGIASIITIVSTIKGTNEQIKQNLIGSGVNAVVVSLYRDDYEYDMQYEAPPEGVRPVSAEDVAALRDLDNVTGVSVFHKRGYADGVYYKNPAYSGAVYGVDDAYFGVYGLTVKNGRGFTEDDFRGFRKVLVIDDSVAGSLFAGEDPVGKTVEIKGEPFTVIGVAAEKKAFTPVINSINDSQWSYYTDVLLGEYTITYDLGGG